MSDSSESGVVLTQEDFDNEVLSPTPAMEAGLSGALLPLFENADCTQLRWLPDSGEFQMKGAFPADTFDDWLSRIHPEDRPSLTRLFQKLRRSGKRIRSVRFRASFDRVGYASYRLFAARDQNRRQPVLSGLVIPSNTDRDAQFESWTEQLSLWNFHSDPAYIRPLREGLGAEAIALLEWNESSEPGILAISIGEDQKRNESPTGASVFSKLAQNEIDFEKGKYQNGDLATGNPQFPALFIQTSAELSDRGLAFVAAFENEAGAADRLELAFVASLLFERAQRMREASIREGIEVMLRQSERLNNLGRLTAGVAHDFSNLLTVIQGHTSFLEREAESIDSSKAFESIALIQKATEQAGSLAKQLLHFGRDQMADFQECDLNEIVSNFVQLMRRMVEETIEIRLNLEESDAKVLVDAGMIGQILMNLVVNARDAMEGKGRISISTELKECDDSGVSGEGNRMLVLVVEDTGPGISANKLEKIFEPFYSTKERNKGTGLGLANVSKLVECHSAKLHATSKEGVGTRFEIEFPIHSFAPALPESEELSRKDHPASATEPVSEANSTPGEKRQFPNDGGDSICGSKVLLVEDESSVRMLVKKLLEMHGCTVIEAASGRKALDLWPEVCDEISVVVSDIVMPDGVSGWDLAKELHLKSPNLGILLTSGYNEKPEDHGLGEDPKIAFLQKPYEAKKLKSNIYELLQEVAS
ncbi:MAG: ATP-binding protein [Verrucomicrobiales bacterium]|nr:ATP-binding protein [Verrucomicrobiales bacterium]